MKNGNVGIKGRQLKRCYTMSLKQIAQEARNGVRLNRFNYLAVTLEHNAIRPVRDFFNTYV